MKTNSLLAAFRCRTCGCLSLLIIFYFLFQLNAVAQTVPITWSVTATATETRSASGSGSLSSNSSGPETPPWPYAGGYDQTTFTPTYSGTCSGSYTLTLVSALAPVARVAADTTGGITWPKFNDNTWSVQLQSGNSLTGNYSFPVTQGVTYWIYCYSYETTSSLTFKWSGATSDSINGNAGNTVQMPRVAGSQAITNYDINWVNSQGGTKVITGFTFSWSCSNPTYASRLTVTANPTYAQTGAITASIANTAPTATTISPTNNAIIESGNPNFGFSYNDNESDPQQSFEIQISTNSAFQTVVYDTGIISNTATSFALPSTNALPYGLPYYWRVRASDNLGSTGSWSQPTSFSTVAPPVVQFAALFTNSLYTTAVANISVNGVASAYTAITQVTWSNDRGGAGVATGTSAWSATGIALQPGTNNLTFTANDAGGGTGSALLPVFAITDTTPPALAITNVTNGSIVFTNYLVIAGTASDSGFGNNGISQVTVNGLAASGGTATGTSIALWSLGVLLNAGTNTLVIVAKDGSQNQNSTTNILTVIDNIPANDNFASRIALAGNSVVAPGSNIGATAETGEPGPAGESPAKSVWWSWQAPSAGTVTVSTLGSGFDTVLAVYTGNSLTNLISVASNDDSPFGGSTSWLTFAAISGMSYDIDVDGYGGAAGAITLTITFQPAIPTIGFNLSGKNIIVKWPSGFTNFVVESTSNLFSPTWTQVPGSPTVVSSNLTLKIPMAGTQQFFRLHAQ